MRTTLQFMTYALVATFFAFKACKKDDAEGGNSSAGEGVVKAKVDGNWVTTESITGAANLVTRVGTLTLQGNSAGTNSKAFVFVINGFEGKGVYSIGGSNNIAVSGSYTETTVNLSNPMKSQVKIWQAPYTGGNEVGKVTVAEVTDTHVTGTFEFKAKNNSDNTIKQISEGSFNLKLKKS